MVVVDVRNRGLTALRILITRASPVDILALPLAVTYGQLGIYIPLGGALIHTALALTFAVLVTSSLLGIPRELEDAASVLGCSGIATFRQIVLPLAAADPAVRDLHLRRASLLVRDVGYHPPMTAGA